MVGLVPLFAVETLEPRILNRMTGFKRRLDWFIQNPPDLTKNVACMETKGQAERLLLSIVDAGQLRRVLHVVLDEAEFLSPYGIRSLSRHHKDHPYLLSVHGTGYRVGYDPGESLTGVFRGNSNWRGPVWSAELSPDRVFTEIADLTLETVPPWPPSAGGVRSK
jgi:hypothetical protein